MLQSRTRFLMALCLVVGLLAATVPAGALPLVPTEVPWLVKSDNVAWHGNVPVDYAGVGGRVVDHANGGTYFYLNGGRGVTVYDIADPLTPIPVGVLEFASSQGENFVVSEDGTRGVLAADGFLPFLPNYATTGVHVIDFSDPTDPNLIATTNSLVAGRGTGLGTSEHTVMCPDVECMYAYGSSTGNIYDLTDAENGVITVLEKKWNVGLDGTAVGGRHALNRDASGLVIADSKPRVVLAVSSDWHPLASPANPIPLAQGGAADVDAGNVSHNNMRTLAEEWTARDVADPSDAIVTRTVDLIDERSTSLVDERPVLRPGELMIGTSESNINPRCSGSNGGISTWSIANFDQGKDIQQLEYFAPFNGTYVDNGAPAAQWAGCSAHWFDVTDDLYVAAAWYEHGTRFFHIGAETGTIEEVGYFQSVNGISASSYWVTDEVVYTVDGVRGLDILVFDRDADARPSTADLADSWIVTANAAGETFELAQQWRTYCRLAVTD